MILDTAVSATQLCELRGQAYSSSRGMGMEAGQSPLLKPLESLPTPIPRPQAFTGNGCSLPEVFKSSSRHGAFCPGYTG